MNTFAPNTVSQPLFIAQLVHPRLDSSNEFMGGEFGWAIMYS